MDKTVLDISDLSVVFDTGRERICALNDLSLAIEPGEIVAVVGESGCGKSVLCKTVMGLLPGVAEVTGGRISINGKDTAGLSDSQYCRIRGVDISMVFQDPMTSLDPTCTIGAQIAEAIKAHAGRSTSGGRAVSRRQLRERVIRLLDAVGIDQPEKRADSYPWMLSGGMRQRAVIAMALSQEPEMLIADEPTTALDVTIQAEILDLLVRLNKERSMSIMLITHDLSVAAAVADRIAVMHAGKIVESGPAKDIFEKPEHPYTRKLISLLPEFVEEPAGGKRSVDVGSDDSDPVVSVRDLSHNFRLGRRSYVQAVRDVSFDIRKGEVLAMVGESGGGKSTVARCLLGIYRPSGGKITFNENYVPDKRRIGFISQDPGTALNPRMKVRDIIAEPLKIQKRFSDKAELDARIRQLVSEVGLEESYLDRYPPQLSGGQNQRVSIARAYGMEPELLIADEPLASLDVTIQAQIAELFSRMQKKYDTTVLFISHDLSMVKTVSDRTAVMYRGSIVELAPTEKIFREPQHSYTRKLLAAVPSVRRALGLEEALGDKADAGRCMP